MAVLVNFKICDNSKDCNGIRECPTGAFHWDEENKTIAVDKDKCINCGKCACCSVDAIHVSHSEEEYRKIKKEIDEDPRSINDLFIDRYGASPIQEEFTTTEEQLDVVLESKRPFIIELYTDDTIECLLKSIPIKEILQAWNKDSTYRKVLVETDKLMKKYDIQDLPALVFIKDKEFLGKIEGYYTTDEKDKLKEEINKIIKDTDK